MNLKRIAAATTVFQICEENEFLNVDNLVDCIDLYQYLSEGNMKSFEFVWQKMQWDTDNEYFDAEDVEEMREKFEN